MRTNNSTARPAADSLRVKRTRAMVNEIAVRKDIFYCSGTSEVVI